MDIFTNHLWYLVLSAFYYASIKIFAAIIMSADRFFITHKMHTTDGKEMLNVLRCNSTSVVT